MERALRGLQHPSQNAQIPRLPGRAGERASGTRRPCACNFLGRHRAEKSHRFTWDGCASDRENAVTHRNGSNAAAAALAAFPVEPPSEINIANRIGELRASGEALEEVLRDARRFAARASRRVPSSERVVLLVDDSEDTLELGELVLSRAGFHVEQAADGAQAVEKAIETLPDVIVMDYEMPIMNGAEAVRRLDSDERTRGIPVVMVSGAPDRVPRDVRLHCAAFLAKPCSADELGTLLHLIIAARGVGTAGHRAASCGAE